MRLHLLTHSVVNDVMEAVAQHARSRGLPRLTTSHVDLKQLLPIQRRGALPSPSLPLLPLAPVTATTRPSPRLQESLVPTAGMWTDGGVHLTSCAWLVCFLCVATRRAVPRLPGHARGRVGVGLRPGRSRFCASAEAPRGEGGVEPADHERPQSPAAYVCTSVCHSAGDAAVTVELLPRGRSPRGISWWIVSAPAKP